jgi:hypothetical protein
MSPPWAISVYCRMDLFLWYYLATRNVDQMRGPKAPPKQKRGKGSGWRFLKVDCASFYYYYFLYLLFATNSLFRKIFTSRVHLTLGCHQISLMTQAFPYLDIVSNVVFWVCCNVTLPLLIARKLTSGTNDGRDSEV